MMRKNVKTKGKEVMIKARSGLCFDDVLLIPKFSTIKSRSEIDISTDLGKGIKLKIPIVSSNMKTVTEAKMASKISAIGGLGIIHRFFNNSEDQIIEFKKAVELERELIYNPNSNIGVSVGVTQENYSLLDKLIEAGAKIISIDIAHAHSEVSLKFLEYVAKKYPEVLLISGSICTWDGAQAVYDAGANVVRCGIGCGSICSTRIETGNGVPQLTALNDVYEQSQNKFKVLADGGCRKAGDIVKSLCFSHAVMLGNMLAGTDETPNEIIIQNGVRGKVYAGSSTHKPNHIEGVVGFVPTKGPVENALRVIVDGVRSGLSYQGVANLEELRQDPEFVLISPAGLVESHPHDITVL